MNAADLRSARAALDVARPAVVRLDVEHAPDHAAVDLRDAWAATETALRAAVGGSGLAGPALVGEGRTRGVLEYPHAHALLAFQSAADRAAFPEYRPTVDDVAAARAGFQALEAALGLGIAADTGLHTAVSRATPSAGQPASSFAPPPYAPPAAPPSYAPPSYAPPPTAPAPATPLSGSSPSDAAPADRAPVATGGAVRARPRNLTAAIVGAVVALAVVAAGLYWLVAGNRTRTMDQAVAEFKAGQRDAARRDFQKAADANSGAALPHVYLARMAREDGDLARASTELETASRLEPDNALARREVGLLLLQTNHPDRAIEYLRTAVQADPTDRVAMGWLGCALIRVGNTSLAQSFFQRSGPGDWSTCRPDAAATAPAAGATTAPAQQTAPAPSYPAPTTRRP
ncbi:hypothetical protein tb265_07840 [Gemmatimonadetes bacterium T265]|nr:hypothetical protein tb265_07840 [Gemmatimonadetes bacterium T265]